MAATTSEPRASTGGPVRVFTRDATGLRKEAGAFDIFIYNINNQNVALGIVFLFGVLAGYPGGNFALTVPLACLLVLPVYFVYSRLSADMPRSGGDYVWVSRILGTTWGPFVGFAMAVTWILSAFVAIGAPMAFMTQFGVAPLMRELGEATGNTGLTDFGTWAYGSDGTLVLGTMLLGFFMAIMLVGVRAYMRIQRYAFLLATAGVVVALIVLVTTSHQDMATRFSDYVSRLGGTANAFAQAEEAGAATAGQAFSGSSTYYATLWTLYMVLFGATSAYIGGEVRQPARTQRFGMFGSLAYTAAFIFLLMIALLGTVGESFFMGLGQVDLGIGFAPTYNEILYSVLAPSLPWALILGVTFVFWTYVWMPINYFTATRLMVALSLDGYLPGAVSAVNRRFGTPHVATLVCGVFGWLSLLLFVNGTITTVTLVFTGITMFLVSGVAAALYPFTLRRVWQASNPKKIAGIPTITIWGVLQVVFTLIVLHIFWSDPVAGISLSPTNTLLNVGAPVLGLVLAVVVIFVRRAQGTDVRLATAEIPPE